MYYQINPTETFRERQLALLEEAEERRLARRLGITRRTILLMATMALMVLVVGGVALAAVVECVVDEACVGTSNSDTLNGTSSQDQMNGRGAGDLLRGGGGFDTMHGGPGHDDVRGDGFDSARGVDTGDALYGEGGPDALRGEAGANAYFGGPGNDDPIDADFAGDGATTENISAGPGRDTILTRDGHPDNIQCGSGVDFVQADFANLDDTAADCEAVNRGAP